MEKSAANNQFPFFALFLASANEPTRQGLNSRGESACDPVPVDGFGLLADRC
jgi:hypothetical protein